MLGVHDLLPHFTVSTVDGRRIAYASLWQRKSVALVCLPRHHRLAGTYADAVAGAFSDAALGDAECLVTSDAIAGVPSPGALVADRWGEIFFAAAPASVDGLPPAQELIDWVRHVQMHCPECEGEAR